MENEYPVIYEHDIKPHFGWNVFFGNDGSDPHYCEGVHATIKLYGKDKLMTGAKYVLRVRATPGSTKPDFVTIADACNCAVMNGKSIHNPEKTAVKFMIAGEIGGKSLWELMWVLDKRNFRRFNKTKGKWLTNYKLEEEEEAALIVKV